MARSSNLRIGTRGSPLALAQAEQVKTQLTEAFPDLAAVLEIVVIKTTGDAITDRPLADAGGKGLFTKEIDDAMLDDSIDLAVHSMKDVPTWLPDGIVLPCMLEREDPRDAFISEKATSLDGLDEGAVVGTASLRRQAQVLARRPDLKVVSFRGNVQTRLKKLSDGDVDATLLAQAGLNRLGRADVATSVIETTDMLPAVGQGAIGITCRGDDRKALHFLGALNHTETVARVTSERALLEVLDGSCRTPIAALAEIAGDRLTLRGMIAKPDGSEVLETTLSGSVANAEGIGQDAGHDLLDRAGPNFLEGH
ncbi:MAG: hydroxymethylbilane synthase [Rhodospirillaceae bacterium]|jgi:hydroxymethylbilane synthase|nr:hydroxymethylbilane synthase [Rhodospirillaceae bacterium]MBT4218705.1 hydroxymethylbilane synthase [Rhodospirillaceae bacterium]MBT5307986.1 hydroxymethylbilane synthase [Rhodospirillaceae bacterium]MBT6407398.1 hydroxymethylbilane synthase [Rhodospirillaceae bacterium]MBT7355869.1 hydroxymethylbilane synthase [Rhodospirillaceae bacterium]